MLVLWLHIFVCFYFGTVLSFAQTSSTTTGHNNQTAGINNGLMVQVNVTAKPEVRKRLRTSAKRDFQSSMGWLRTITPAHDVINDPIPPPSGSLNLILGSNTWSCSVAHCAVLIDGSPTAVNKELLSVDRHGNSMQVSAVLMDKSGKVIAVMDKSQTHVNPNNAFDWRRPDEHTIDVVDQYNRHVLHVRFANPHAIRIEGDFYSSSSVRLLIEDDWIWLDNKKSFSNTSWRYSGGISF